MAVGSNKTLPNPSQTITVKPKKDKLAGNVGGNAHMNSQNDKITDQKITAGKSVAKSGSRK